MDNIASKFALCLIFYVILAQNANGYTEEEMRTRIVKGKYLVQLHDGKTASELSGILFVKNLREYKVGKISIAAFEMDDEHVNVLKAHPSIKHLEPNGLVKLIEPVEILSTPNSGRKNSRAAEVKPGMRDGCSYQELNDTFFDYGTWGLIRTSYWNPPDVQEQPYLWDYDGEGVRAYVFDTGIELNHFDFEGRAVHGMYADEFADEGKTDYHGHGTHVASTVAGGVYGMAKKATMVDVKVLGGNGWGILESNIQGLQWVAADVKHKKTLGRVKAVINMSLGYAWHSHIFRNAVQETVDLGVTNVVAAGNSAVDSIIYTPAAFDNTITIAAIERENDRMIWWSNFGPGVDLAAPGVLITGAWSLNSTMCEGQAHYHCLTTVSGTSMASPHVAGAVARYLSSIPDEKYDAMDPKHLQEHIREMLIEKSGKDFLLFQNENQKTTPNRYLYLGCGEVPDDQTTTTTVATPQPEENGAGRVAAAVSVLVLMIATIMFG